MIQAADSDEDANRNVKPKSHKNSSGVIYSIWKKEGF